MFRKLFRLLLGSTRRRVVKPKRKPTSTIGLWNPPTTRVQSTEISGRCFVIDGDTIVIRGIRLRIFGIDAPELDHPWGRVSKGVMIKLCKGRVVTATIQDHVSYDRLVAKCHLHDGTDLAAELVKQGLALDWPRFSGGIYRHLEPEGARKRMWRADAKQKGRFIEEKN